MPPPRPSAPRSHAVMLRHSGLEMSSARQTLSLKNKTQLISIPLVMCAALTSLTSKMTLDVQSTLSLLHPLSYYLKSSYSSCYCY